MHRDSANRVVNLEYLFYYLDRCQHYRRSDSTDDYSGPGFHKGHRRRDAHQSRQSAIAGDENIGFSGAHQNDIHCHN